MAKNKREQTWRQSTSPTWMLGVLEGKRLPRQRRLFAVACCRRYLNELPDPESRQAVATAERYADGLADRAALRAAHDAAQRVAMGRIEAARRMPVSEQAAAYNLWRLAYAAQLTCSSSKILEASATLVRRASYLSDDEEQREIEAHCDLIRDIFGNPFNPRPALDPAWLRWQGGTVPKLARGIYEEQRFGGLPVLADALEEAGCADADLLAHLRGGGEHAPGCWALDAALGKT